jgi:hypothetical protein
MALATTKGKEFALKALEERRKKYADKKSTNNSALPAGSPMYFDCKGCNADIVVPETYLSRPQFCEECGALKQCGWLQ